MTGKSEREQGKGIKAVAGPANGNNRMYYRQVAVTLLFLCLFLGSPAISAESIPLKLTGMEILQMGLDGKTIIARGNVELTYGSVWVKADELTVDTVSGEILARGNVKVKRADESLSGGEFVYNVFADEGSLKEARGTVSGEGIKGDVFVGGRTINFSPTVVHIENGTLTTCDLASPHYHLSAGEISVYLDDRVVIRGVTYWEGRIPLFYWPYLSIPIKDGSTFELPRIGYSDATGWYVKNSYAYYFTWGKGHLYLDYFQKKGWGYGMEHTYIDTDRAVGSVYLYRLQNRESGKADWEAKWKQKLTVAGDWNINWEAGYRNYHEQNGPARSIDTLIAMERLSDAGGVSLNYHRTEVMGTKPSLKQTAGAAASYRTGPWQLRLKSDWKSDDLGLGADERLSYLGELTRTADNYKLTLKAEQFLNPSEDEDKPVAWRRINRMPEITVETRSLKPFGLRTSLEASLGRYQEYPANLSTWRVQTAGRVLDKMVPLSDNLSLTLGGSASMGLYGTGHRRLVAKGSATASYRLDSAVLSVAYRNTEVFGATPFNFDRETPSETLSPKAVWRGDRVAVSLSTSYNLYMGLWDDLSGQVQFRPTDWLDTNLRATYDWYDRSLGTVAGMAAVEITDGVKAKVGAVYDVSGQRLNRADGEITLSFRDWEFSYKGAFDGIENKYLVGDVKLTRDLHCREISLRYNQQNGEVWLEYSLNAFPRTKVKVGAEDESILFDAEGFDELTSLLQGE